MTTITHNPAIQSSRAQAIPANADCRGVACYARGLTRHASAVLTSAVLAAALLLIPTPAHAQESEKILQRHIEESLKSAVYGESTKGSTYNSRSYLAELGRDPKAAIVGDLVTIRVVEQASALSSGASSTSRDTEVTNNVTSFLGSLNPAGALANLAEHEGERSLDAEGSTSRQTSVTTTFTAQVTHVMPNGNLVIEGIKEVAVNSERQLVWLRGMVRPVDLAPDNSVRSDRVAMMELRINGKGIVNDAIKRPNVFMRIVKGLLPF